jgi:hypothetical protein
VFYKTVRQTQTSYLTPEAVSFCSNSSTALPKPPQRVFSSNRQYAGSAGSLRQNKIFIQRFDKAGIQDGTLNPDLGQHFGCLQSGCGSRPDGKQR